MTVNHASIAEQKANGTGGRFGEKRNTPPGGELSVPQSAADVLAATADALGAAVEARRVAGLAVDEAERARYRRGYSRMTDAEVVEGIKKAKAAHAEAEAAVEEILAQRAAAHVPGAIAPEDEGVADTLVRWAYEDLNEPARKRSTAGGAS